VRATLTAVGESRDPGAERTPEGVDPLNLIWIMPAKGTLTATSRTLTRPSRRRVAAAEAHREARAGVGRTLRRAAAAAWPPLLVLALAVGAWEAVVRMRHVDPTVLPAPSVIARAGWGDRGALGHAAWVTLQETSLALLASLAGALLLGVLIDGFPWVRRSVYPLLVASQTLPIVAIAPLVVIWLGYGLAPHVMVAALYTFFPIVVGLVQGLAATDEDTTSLLRTMGASRRQLLWRARLPSALPQLFTGLRVAVTFAVVAAVIAEYVGAFDGLGIYMVQQSNARRADLVFAAVGLTAIVTLALFAVVAVVERLVLGPRRPARRGARW
jgi:ABC-type nitrate/sulfonate/bicarbonate transport system permease component